MSSSINRASIHRREDAGSLRRTVALIRVLPIWLIGLVFMLLIGGSARAAGTDFVAVNTTIDSFVSLSDACASSFDISVVASSFQSDTCAYGFGSTNDATTTLRISSLPGPLLSGGVFADHVGGCAPLTGDTAGIKVSGVGSGVTSQLGCTVSAAGSNADFRSVPDVFTNTCSGTTMGAAANQCTLAVGIRETGGDAPSGAVGGTVLLDVIG